MNEMGSTLPPPQMLAHSDTNTATGRWTILATAILIALGAGLVLGFMLGSSIKP